MTDKFNRATYLQGSVNPVAGGGVRVALDDPQNKVLAAGLGTLASRLDSFKSQAFQVAGAQAKAAGTAYGARNPITKSQIEKAARLGQQVEIVGDPSSINIYEQAAYAGSLAVTESQFTAQGRRALSDAMAEAAMDQSMDPQKFTAKLDTIINEFSGAMSQLSPSSGAKVSASLASMANGQIVSYSRTYATNLKKALKDDAYSGLSDIRSSLLTAIDGYVPPSEDDIDMAAKAGETPATLQDIYAARRAEAENLLINAGESQKTVNSQLKQLDKDWVETQKNAVIDWAQKDDYANNTGAAYTDLTGGKAPPRIQKVFENLTSTDRVKVLSGIMKIHKQQSSLDAEEDEAIKISRANSSIKIQAQMNRDDLKGDTAAWNARWKELNKVDPERAKALMSEKEVGVVTRDVVKVVEGIENDIANPNYDLEVQAGTKTSILQRIAKARTNKQMRKETAQTLRTRVMQLQDKDFKTALGLAATAFSFDYDSFSMDPRLDKFDNLKNYKTAENKLRRVYKKNPEIDLDKAMQTIIADIEKSTTIPFEEMLEDLPVEYRSKAKWKALLAKANADQKTYGTVVRSHIGIVNKIKKKYKNEWDKTDVQ
tara:strand:- start:5813 stop:7609 length:1797 start_codon:yes stop_codon:yes gene_type:complete